MHEFLDAESSTSPALSSELTDEPTEQTLQLHFTGSGKEYFRIWIVNLLLTVATLGIYSAWAKVRRLQYFDRNTRLANASFDFSGDPRAILKGRLLAVALLGLYHYAFGFSLAFGMALAAVLALGLPFLLRGALRFRLANTHYRGLRFGFDGAVGGAYRVYLPPVVTVLLPGVLASINPQSKLLLLVPMAYLAWPLMYGHMKGYQQRYLRYGDQRAQFAVPARRFFRPYLWAGLLVLAGVVGAVALVTLGSAALARRGTAGLNVALNGVFIAVPIIYISILATIPLLQARISNLVWSNTTWPGLRIHSSLRFWGMLKLQAANTLLTLLTLGLYRPFAVVRVYRYRLAHLSVQASGRFDDIVARTVPRQGGGAGDGAADFIGIDLSW
jgi:uncharacterized membrane protein YjgN (DUF898 family)